jgi:uncharacterized protein (DUF1778 family)
LYGELSYDFDMLNSRTALLEIRIEPEALTIVKRAAELQGRNVGDFVVTAVQEAASRIISEAQIVRLSVADQRTIAEAVLNPPTPGESLRRAAVAYRRHLNADG